MRTKLTKKSTDTTVFTVDFGVLLASVTSVTGTAGITISAIVLNPINILLPDGDTVTALNGVQFTVAGGLDKTEYLITVTAVVQSDSSVMVKNFVLINSNTITDVTEGQHQTTFNYYGSYLLSVDYFFGYSDWGSLTNIKQLAALMRASRAIDALNFEGTKTYGPQPQQFPRNGNYDIPQDIINATYEEALALTDGIDPQTEQSELNVTSEGIGTARQTYDRAFVLPNVRAGIMSPIAWGFLTPYLQEIRELNISREN